MNSLEFKRLMTRFLCEKGLMKEFSSYINSEGLTLDDVNLDQGVIYEELLDFDQKFRDDNDNYNE